MSDGQRDGRARRSLDVFLASTGRVCVRLPACTTMSGEPHDHEWIDRHHKPEAIHAGRMVHDDGRSAPNLRDTRALRTALRPATARYERLRGFHGIPLPRTQVGA
jgi:hypothetical protein